ncbi:alpha/beta hydrolase fold domain-containing protein [Sinomonas sp. JGH33]|uniref:Alpha/beta hydrolase fold domain-containing protein n=1 Tax=Sinomonas terricola TaxID=3110330 RepID=A0ABU5T7Y3_9MICC|nr:alpha/beta hydrolase fold domain-containing protein [Sinomonas sp. JGH33]MEA5455792.1 alpha/beta hydrolase fold domain-containing protein [Sinomonas sp. JGH33]
MPCASSLPSRPPTPSSSISTAAAGCSEKQLVLDRQAMEWFWGHYAPVERRSEPEACPLRATSFAGLPRAAIALAEFDPPFDEGRAYASALRSAGVPVTDRVFLGQMHGFISLYGTLPASAELLEWIAERVGETVRPH